MTHTTYCLTCSPNVIPDSATFSLGRSCPNCSMNQNMLQTAVTLVHIEDEGDTDNSLSWTDSYGTDWLDEFDLENHDETELTNGLSEDPMYTEDVYDWIMESDYME